MRCPSSHLLLLLKASSDGSFAAATAASPQGDLSLWPNTPVPVLPVPLPMLLELGGVPPEALGEEPPPPPLPPAPEPEPPEPPEPPVPESDRPVGKVPSTLPWFWSKTAMVKQVESPTCGHVSEGGRADAE